MSEKNMPVAEAGNYELAFHILPTVAEGEVPSVFDKLKTIVTKQGGAITAEEAPARFDLAYEIVKYLEGRNRKFTSAYFGWIRFTIDPANVDEIADSVKGTKELLRHLLIKLNKTEEENPFFFHEAIAHLKQVETIDLDEEESGESEEGEEGDEKEVEESDLEAETEVRDGTESTDKV